MLWLLASFDLSFGPGLRAPLEDYSKYAGYGIGADFGFRYFFTERFGLGLTAGGYYHFQKRDVDSSVGAWYKQTTQVTLFPASLNLVMKFYLSEGMYLLVSFGGGGNYALYNYERRVGIDSTLREEKGSYNVGGYLLNFESALRMTDFDLFMGINILNTQINRFSLKDKDTTVEKTSYPELYIGVRYYRSFGV